MGKSRQTGKLSSDGILYPDITNSRVGIGTTIPTQTVDIRGSLRVTGGLYDSNNVVGAAGSVLISTGVGVSWSASAGSGGQGADRRGQPRAGGNAHLPRRAAGFFGHGAGD